MNERIEKLYKEAVNSASAELHEWNKNWRWGNHTNFEYEKVLYKKFAELVWKAAYEEGHDVGVDAGFEAGRNASFTEQNFGVEE